VSLHQSSRQHQLWRGFCQSHPSRLSGDDFYDLNSGVDAVIAKGYIDTNNLFVTGGSGGGVLTCWTIEHTERFRAGSLALIPSSNWYSFALTSDIPFITKYWFPGLPWDNTDNYMPALAHQSRRQVKTPTLVMTGEADYRTPIFRSRAVLRSAQASQRGNGSRPRSRRAPRHRPPRPSHHIAKMLYIAGWFEQHKSKM